MATEFDPTSETHHPLLIIKAVEPGCTTELQIEDARIGKVVRLTTTDRPANDDAVFEAAVVSAWRVAWLNYQKTGGVR